MYGECMYSSVLLPRPSLYRYRVLPPKSNPRLDIGTGTFPHRIFASSCSSSPPPSTHHFLSWSWIIISLFFSVGVVFFFVSFSFSCFIFSAFFPFYFLTALPLNIPVFLQPSRVRASSLDQRHLLSTLCGLSPSLSLSLSLLLPTSSFSLPLYISSSLLLPFRNFP